MFCKIVVKIYTSNKCFGNWLFWFNFYSASLRLLKLSSKLKLSYIYLLKVRGKEKASTKMGMSDHVVFYLRSTMFIPVLKMLQSP